MTCDEVHIPIEILEKMLLHLPPKSESLGSLMDDPNFRAKDFHYSSRNHVPSSYTSLFLDFHITVEEEGVMVPKDIDMKCDANCYPLYECSTAAELHTLNILNSIDDDASLIHCSSEYVKLGVTKEMIRDRRMPRMSSQCDGLLCLCDCSSNVFLCDPSTKDCRSLPPCFAKQNDHDDDYLMESSCGLGYDPRDEDYKIIMIVNSYDDDAEPRAELYSLRSNSWRQMDLGSAKDLTRGFNLEDKVYLKGVYYHLSSTYGLKPMIFAFDMSEEEFNCISTPTCCDYYQSIAVWNERVAVFSVTSLGVMQMWAMDGGGHAGHVRGDSNSCFWTKHFVIWLGLGVDRAKPLLFWKGDDELLLEILNEGTKKRKLISYNIGKGKYRYLAFGDGSSPDHDQGYDSRFNVCNVLPYVKR